MSFAISFHTAITRMPAFSAIDGLRANDNGNPNMQLMLGQHRDYLLALKQAGVVVVELPPLDQFPDAQFVEDTALCLPGLAIMMRPGAETRRGEVAPMRDALALIFDEIADIHTGFIEAGDINTVQGRGPATTLRVIAILLEIHQDAPVGRPCRPFHKKAFSQQALASAIYIHDAYVEGATQHFGKGDDVAARRHHRLYQNAEWHLLHRHHEYRWHWRAPAG